MVSPEASPDGRGGRQATGVGGSLPAQGKGARREKPLTADAGRVLLGKIEPLLPREGSERK